MWEGCGRDVGGDEGVCGSRVGGMWEAMGNEWGDLGGMKFLGQNEVQYDT